MELGNVFHDMSPKKMLFIGAGVLAVYFLMVKRGSSSATVGAVANTSGTQNDSAVTALQAQVQSLTSSLGSLSDNTNSQMQTMQGSFTTALTDLGKNFSDQLDKENQMISDNNKTLSDSLTSMGTNFAGALTSQSDNTNQQIKALSDTFAQQNQQTATLIQGLQSSFSDSLNKLSQQRTQVTAQPTYSQPSYSPPASNNAVQQGGAVGSTYQYDTVQFTPTAPAVEQNWSIGSNSPSGVYTPSSSNGGSATYQAGSVSQVSTPVGQSATSTGWVKVH